MARTNTHDWLSLVSMSGLVVSEPVLAEAFPGGPERVPPRWLQRLPREWEHLRLNKGADPQGRWWMNSIARCCSSILRRRAKPSTSRKL